MFTASGCCTWQKKRTICLIVCARRGGHDWLGRNCVVFAEALGAFSSIRVWPGGAAFDNVVTLITIEVVVMVVVVVMSMTVIVVAVLVVSAMVQAINWSCELMLVATMISVTMMAFDH